MAVVTACVGAAVAIGGSLVSANQSKQAAKGYRNEAERKAGEIAEIEANRQSIPNPYANVKDLSGIAKEPPIATAAPTHAVTTAILHYFFRYFIRWIFINRIT